MDSYNIFVLAVSIGCAFCSVLPESDSVNSSCNTCCQGQPGPAGVNGVSGNNGNNGSPGRDGFPGRDGAKGDSGIKGEAGEIGPSGPSGPPGPQGPSGVHGDKGLRGLPGNVGPVGMKGANGSDGEKGQKGDVGSKGEEGSVGSKGDTGSVGPNGYKGSKGSKGEVGQTRHQSVFTAIKTNNQDASSSNEIIDFTRIVTNIGEDFDINTDRFTCQIPGVYMFTYGAYANTVASGEGVDLQLVKDGVRVVMARTEIMRVQIGASVALQLAVGEQVWISLLGNNEGIACGSDRCFFTGYILHEDN